MNGRTNADSTPQPVDGGIASQHQSGHHVATPYSSSVEGASTDFNSSRATSYDSADQSWGMDYGHQGHGPGDHHWSPGMSHPPLPIHHLGSAQREGIHRSHLPTTRSRTIGNARASPAARKTAPSAIAPKARKARTAKPSKLSPVSLDGPLSVVTKDSTVPLKDMESFVNRSTEERVKEKEKKNGYIVRPMNAFMLYRSAYADRAKGLFEQNNHQVVSKATGMSWRMESKAIQAHYKMLSDIERENHQKAWPNYKFTPSKPNSPSRRRKGEDVSEDEGTEQDPTDYDWTPAGPRKPQATRSTNVRYGPEKAFEVPYTGHAGYPPQLTRIEYQYPPGRPMPMQMESFPGMEMGYYPEHSRMYQHGRVEDSRCEPLSYGYPTRMVQVPSGFPGMNHEDLFEMGYMPENNYAHQGLVDPKLEEFGQVHDNGMFTEDGFADYHGEMLQHAQRTETGLARPEEGAGSSILDMLSTDPEGFQKWVQNENQA